MEMKLKKEEVYVEVTTQEEADRAREMLLKYGEKIWEDDVAFKVTDRKKELLIDDDEDWMISHGSGCTQVTLEQLEEILSHKTESQRITALEAEVKELMEWKESFKKWGEDNSYPESLIDTKEQPKPKFEVGKVYRSCTEFFYCSDIKENNVIGFGFSDGKWLQGQVFDYQDSPKMNFTEATQEEWLKRLKQEAEKRGFKKRVKAQCLHVGYKQEIQGGLILWNNGSSLAYQYLSGLIMKDGKWAEIIEPKFEVGMFGAFSLEGTDYWIYGDLEGIDTERDYKFKCSNGYWYEIFKPIKEIIWA